jgi:thioredoxin reductase
VAAALQPRATVFDVVVIGGGPAGLSAALVLGRCRRRVLVCDTGHPRNAAAREMHGYLSRDGCAPLELLRIGREELARYGVEWRQVTVTDVVTTADHFDVRLETGEHMPARKVLIASGVRDHLPEIEGLRECYGVTVHHCPYCDGWEVRDRTIAVLGRGRSAAGLALSLKTWTDRVVVCTNGRARMTPAQRAQLSAHAIALHEARIERLEHEDGYVRRFAMRGGAQVPCEAVFFSSGQSLQCSFPSALGCEFTPKGTVKTDHLGQTRVPGVYVVGDASRDVQFVIVAAAEGAKAGVAINKALQAGAGLAAAPAPS